MGCIYLIRNLKNNKCYIGQTIHDAEKTRIRDHLRGKGSQSVRDAIEKYGQEAFTYEILHDGIIPEFLDDYEREAIAKFNTVSPNGYNLTDGGGSPSKETRRKMSEAHKGRPAWNKGKPAWNKGKSPSEETRRKISKARKGKYAGENHPMYGKPRSEETKLRMSQALKGKTFSEERRQKHLETMGQPEVRQKLSKALIGYKHTKETRRKMSESRKGSNNPRYGNPHSEETKRKMSKSKELPEKTDAYNFFFSLPSDMKLKEKRRLLYKKFMSVRKDTLYAWTYKWTINS